MKELELYIHIPFCKSKCYYCDFCSTASTKNINAYIDRLISESNNFSGRLNNYVVKSIFIGGGTPTILKSGLLKNTFSKIIGNFNTDIIEFTVEANPDTIIKKKMQELKEMGVNRISLGVQTLNDNILKTLNRTHSSEIAINAIKLSKKYFDNVSVDMMLGLPNQKNYDIEYCINKFNELGVNHISCYTLQLEDKTVLKNLVDNDKIVLPTDEETAEMYDYAFCQLKKFGYSRYEISNFAKNNAICLHNYGYWTRKDYLGLGVSSHSLIDNYRFCNTNNLNDYINGADYINIEKLSKSDQIFEEIMLRLRTKNGINISDFNKKYQIDFTTEYSNVLKKLENYLDINKNFVSIKEKYFEISNSIIVEFLLE